MRRQRLAYLFPFALGCAGALQLLLYSIDPPPEVAHLLTRATLFVKLPAIGGLVYLLYSTSQFVRAEDSRWRTLTAVWIVTGVGVLALAASFHRFVHRAEFIPRIWPGDELDPAVASVMGFPNYSAANLVAYELAAIVFIAGFIPQVMRRVCRYQTGLVAVGLPFAVVFALGFYWAVAPWSFVMDYDTFIGDSLLGGVIAQLLFFAHPIDPAGAVTLAVAATTMFITGERWSSTSPPREFGGMGPDGFVKLGFRNELAAIEDDRERELRYEDMVAGMDEVGRGVSMADHFEIDDVISPIRDRQMAGVVVLTPETADHGPHCG